MSKHPITHQVAQWVEAATSTPPARVELAVGTALGEYVLLSKLASGGMANVWAAVRRREGGQPELVALKTILPQLVTDRAFVRMFLDEVSLLAAIHHPNVIEVRDVGLAQGVPYVALEWVDGDTLGQLMKHISQAGDELPLAATLRVVGEACLGLHVAHELTTPDGQSAGVIHRDVSPSNILVSASGDVKLIDFGVAKAVSRLTEQTQTGVLKGKVTYMAPEQAMRREIDRRVDVWAAGVVFYRMVTGRVPYRGSMIEVYEQLRLGAPYAPLPRHVPEPLAQVIRKALSRDREGRYQSAAELRRAIQFVAAELCAPLSKEQFAQLVRRYLSERLRGTREQIRDALSSAGFT